MQPSRTIAELTVSFSKKLIVYSIALIMAVSVSSQLLWNAGVQNLVTGGLRTFMDLSSDESIPTWYASLILLLIALASLVIGIVERQAPAPRKHRYFWFVIATVFLLLSIDEVARIHETAGGELSYLIAGDTSGLFYYEWVIVGLPFAILFGITSIPFLLTLHSKTRNLFILSGIVFLSGAVGVEMFNGRYEEAHGAMNNTYMLWTALEELLEMAGSGLFLIALIQYLSSRFGSLQLHLVEKETTQ